MKLGRSQDTRARARTAIYSGVAANSGESRCRRDESVMELGRLVRLRGVYRVDNGGVSGKSNYRKAEEGGVAERTP